MKTALQGIGGLVLSILLLYWVFHDKDPQALSAALMRASLPALALAAFLNLAHNVFRVLRWGWLLGPVRKRVPFRPMFSAVILGFMTTLLVPGRVGELVRPALLSAREDLPLGPCLGTVVADRLLDGVTIVALFAVGSLGAHFVAGSSGLAGEIRMTAAIALAVIVAGLFVLVLMSTFASELDAWLSRRVAPLRFAGRVALGLSRGVEALRSPRRLVPIVAYSLAVWLLIGLATWTGIRAAGADIGFSDTLVMLPLLALGVSLPTPGGVGGYHALMQFGLVSLFGVDPTVAAGAGILMHLAIVLPVLVLGPVLLYVDGVSLADLVAAGKQVRALGHAQPTIEAAR
jgi:glycosyltransferase 2 family protein